MDLSWNNLRFLFYQICRFGVVGLAATFIHIAVFTLLVEMGMGKPMAANVFAFIPAFFVSFYFHMVWTFRSHSGSLGWHLVWPMWKFLLVALLGLALNSFGVHLVTEILKVEYYFSTLFFLFVTPTVLFLLNKHIVFK